MKSALAGPLKSVGFSDATSDLTELPPLLEENSELATDREGANEGSSHSEKSSELGDDEAFDEEQEGEMEYDD